MIKNGTPLKCYYMIYRCVWYKIKYVVKSKNQNWYKISCVKFNEIQKFKWWKVRVCENDGNLA